MTTDIRMYLGYQIFYNEKINSVDHFVEMLNLRCHFEHECMFYGMEHGGHQSIVFGCPLKSIVRQGVTRLGINFDDFIVTKKYLNSIYADVSKASDGGKINRWADIIVVHMEY